MIPTAYKCKICGAEHVAMASDDGDPAWNITLAKLLVCDRCADYRQGRRKYGEAIATVCAQIRGALLSSKGLSQSVEDEARKQLRNLTQSYARVACRHRGMADVWDEEWVNMLVEKPDKVWIILREYEAGLQATKTKARAAMAKLLVWLMCLLPLLGCHQERSKSEKGSGYQEAATDAPRAKWEKLGGGRNLPWAYLLTVDGIEYIVVSEFGTAIIRHDRNHNNTLLNIPWGTNYFDVIDAPDGVRQLFIKP